MTKSMDVDNSNAGDYAWSKDVEDALGELESPRRPWQLIVTGNGGAMPDGGTLKALDRILELFPCLESLVVTTADGNFHVGRDFASEYTRKADRILVGVFKDDPAVTGVTFRWSGKLKHHTATRDDPYCSASGKYYARIDAAVARGEMTTAQAIAACREIAQRAAASDDAHT